MGACSTGKKNNNKLYSQSIRNQSSIGVKNDLINDIK